MSDELEQEAQQHDENATHLYQESAMDLGRAAKFEISGDHDMAHESFDQAQEERTAGDAEHSRAEDLRHQEDQTG